LIVSHDRRFLDNVVTSTIAFEGNGKILESVGGYEDYLRQKQAPTTPATQASSRQVLTDKLKKKKRSFKEEREYKELPNRISALEAEQKKLQSSLADPGFYRQGGAAIKEAVDRTEQVDRELLDAMARWDQLDSI